MKVIEWVVGNPMATVIGIAVVLFVALVFERGCYGDEMYEKGKTDERVRILSLPPDTVKKQSEPVQLAAKPKQTTGNSRLRTEQEKKALEQTVSSLAQYSDSLEEENAKLKSLIDEKLLPYSAQVEGEAVGATDRGDTLRLPYAALIDTDPNTRLTQVLVKFFPFSFPEREIIRHVPIPEITPWFHPYHWIVLGAILLKAMLLLSP